MMWDGTVTTELIPEEQLFTKVIGLSQQEYKLLRYKVRVQNQILGAVETSMILPDTPTTAICRTQTRRTPLTSGSFFPAN